MKPEELKFENPERPFDELMRLLPHFCYYDYLPGREKTQVNILKAVHQHCENVVETILDDIEMLAKFLYVGVSEKTTGAIKETEILKMSYHIKSMANLGGALFNLKEHSRANLEARGEKCEL